MTRYYYLLLLALVVLTLGTLVLADSDDDHVPESSSTDVDRAESDERIAEHRRHYHARWRSDEDAPQTTSTADAESEETPESVEGVNRHCCKPCKEKKKCCCKHQPTPTYHISLCKEDQRFKTISLPAQGRPFNYNDDVRHSSAPPLVRPCCTNGYCYEPCCQPTCGIYGTQPPHKLCCDHLVPCRHQPPPPPPCCCQPPPPPCCCPPPPPLYGCPPPPYGCGYGCPPPPCGCPPPPCCDCYAPPPPFVYDECLDKHKCKGKLKGHKHRHGHGHNDD